MSPYLRRVTVASLILLIFTNLSFATDSSGNEEKPVIDVVGKIVPHDYFEIFNQKIPLPRIFYVEGDFYFYANTNEAVQSGDFIVHDEQLVRAEDRAPISLDFSITSHLIFLWIGILITLLITIWASSKYKKGVGRDTEPKGTSLNLFEVFFVFIRDDIAKEFIPQGKHVKFVPYLFSVFMAISFMNLFGLLPWGISPTANLTVTATLAGLTFFVTQINGSKDHWEHVFAFPGVHPAMRIILTPVEILGLFTKPFALAVRLFANMLSGKILIVCTLGLIFIFSDIFGILIGASSSVIWVGLTSLLYILKGFIGLLQAYIFTLLSAVFIGMAVEEHHHEEHDHDSAVAATVAVEGEKTT